MVKQSYFKLAVLPFVLMSAMNAWADENNVSGSVHHTHHHTGENQSGSLKDEKTSNATELESITVKGMRLPEISADRNLSKVETVSQEELGRRGFDSISEALQKSTAASIGGSRSWVQGVDLRGQGEDAWGMNKGVRVMIDGVPADVNKSHGSSDLDSIIGIEEIDHIEVLPGGGAVQYGDGARGGAVNIITKGYTQDKLSLGTKFNSFGHGQNGGSISIDAAKKLFDGLALAVNAERQNKDGYRDFVKDRNTRINTRAFINFNEDNRLSLAYGYSKNKWNGFDSLTLEKAQDNPRQNTHHDNTITTRRRSSADFVSNVSGSLKLNANLFWRNEKTPGSWSNFEDDIVGGKVGAKFSYADKSYLQGGINHENHIGDTTYVSGNVASVKKKSNGVWVMDNHQFNDLFSLAAGARYAKTKYAYDYNGSYKSDSNNFAAELTPRLHYSDSVSVYARFVRGFITPNPSQFRGSKSSPNPQGGRPITSYYMVEDLKPATFNTFEIGGDHHLHQLAHTQINWAIFNTDTRNDIATVGDVHGNSTLSYAYNIDKTRRTGFEIGLKHKIADKLSLYENLNFVDAKRKSGEAKGEKVPYVSKVKATAGVNYAWTDNLDTFADLSYYSKARDNTNKDTKPYALFDVGAKYQYKGFSVSGGIKNLFNKKYYAFQGNTTGQGGTQTTYDPANGHNFYVNLKYEF
ncbi:MAG: TonB-dependent receptor [Neisseriaceae bacterium]|nr:TonB-dependent receptor [Neisseriaceae bacterium]